MTVKPLPQLQMNVNGVVVTNANDGTDNTGSFAVCNTGSNNIDITQVAEQLGVNCSNPGKSTTGSYNKQCIY